MSDFDVIVIGTGVAGRTAAPKLAEAGKRVALVDRGDFGGTCALRGCEPKKTLFTIAEIVERARAGLGNGVTGAPGLDWANLVRFKRGLIEHVPEEMEASLRAAGITTLHGVARFLGPDVIDVAGHRLTAEHFVVATGAKPAPLNIAGENLVRDSEDFMATEKLRDEIAFIGGGYVAFEFAHMAATAGAHVTILHRGERVLEQFDQDLAERLTDSYRDKGIDVRTKAAVNGVELLAQRGPGEIADTAAGSRIAAALAEAEAAAAGAGGALVVSLADGSSLACDAIFHAAGRVPDLDALDLPAAAVDFGRRGIEVDAGMRSVSNPRVFAVGDAADLGAPLTPPGIAEGRVAAQNILEPGSAVYDPIVTPTVVFADPPLAAVGMSEEQARAAGLSAEVKFTDMSAWDSSKRAGVRSAGAKVVLERSTGRMLGAHLLGPHADEVINVFALAIARGLTRDDLASMLWAYPTGGSEIAYLV